MDVKVNMPEGRELVIDTTVDELADFHEALTTKRRTKRQQEILNGFADVLVDSDSNLAAIIHGRVAA